MSTKTKKWAEEEEIRFIGERQDVNLIFDGHISEVTFGPNVPTHTLEKLVAHIANHCSANNIRITILSSEGANQGIRPDASREPGCSVGSRRTEDGKIGMNKNIWQKICAGLATICLVLTMATAFIVAMAVLNGEWLGLLPFMGVIVGLSILWRFFDWLGNGTWLPTWASDKNREGRFSK